MKEKEFINIIKSTLNSNYIGDDCAYLPDLGIVITQDSLVEDIHFKRDWISPFQLGYKSVMVNISDVAASGAEPKYITISLSLPANIDNSFIKDFYKGAKFACADNVKIVGGDITGADKIYISVCAIGATAGRNISSRKNAQVGQKIILSGTHGASAAGLRLLKDDKKEPEKLLKAHLEPCAKTSFAKKISTIVKGKYAMTDTSDGLADALCNIAYDSSVKLEIDFSKIPHDKEIEIFDDWQNLVLYGGEDYEILATVDKDFQYGYEIGEVKKGLGIDIKFGDNIIHLNKEDVENKIFNHF